MISSAIEILEIFMRGAIGLIFIFMCDDDVWKGYEAGAL